MTDFTPHETRFTGRKMLLAITTFFGVIIAVNATMLTLAVQSFGGLVVGNSYVASQSFNEDVAAAKAQPIRGWDLRVETSATDLSLYVSDETGRALSGRDLSIAVARATHDRNTVTLSLTERVPGLYDGAVELAPGRWLATVTTDDGQTRSFAFTHRRSVP